MQYPILEDALLKFILNPFFFSEKGGNMNKLIILFYLNTSRLNQQGTAPLLIRLTIDGVRKHLNTGLLISPKQWNREKQVIKSNHPQSVELNKLLASKKSGVEEVFYKCSLDGKQVTMDEFLHVLDSGFKKEYGLLEVFEINNQNMRSRLGIDYRHSTLKKYLTTYQKVKDYLTHEFKRTDIPLYKLERGFIQNFVLFLKREQGIGHNTIVKYAKNLKTVVNNAVTNGWLEKSPFEQFRIGYKLQEKVYLSREELLAIEQKKFRLERLNLVRDLFVFQCYTGLAYADMFKLTGREVTTGIDGHQWIITKRQKTEVRSSIPLLPKAFEVIEKYNPNYKTKPDEHLLPVYTNQKFNLYLHEIAELCGIEKNLTSHVGRRTFATTVALGHGVSIETISKVLGHSSTKITHQYAMTTDLKVSEEMNKLKKAL